MNKLLLCLFTIIMAMPAYAATIRVERDGSADFTVIQDAVNAAASGDTVYIGPGRYNEGEIVSTAGWTEFVRVLVHQNELTLIGAGPYETILGPTAPFDFNNQGDDRGIVAGPYFGCNSLRVENMGFENMGRGVRGSPSPDIVVVENCQFFSNDWGLIVSSGSSLEVNACLFNLPALSGGLISCSGTNHVSISDCDFVYEEETFYSGYLVQLNGVAESNFHNCTFSEGDYGLRFDSGDGISSITGCQFTGQSQIGLDVSGYNVSVDNCLFEQQKIAVRVSSLRTDLTFRNSAIVGVTDVSFNIFGVDGFEVTDSIIAHGPEYSVRQPEYSANELGTKLRQLLMINNDWGTTDAETIASWIYLRDYEAQYIPFIGQPVTTESMTLDGVKALYR